MKKKLFIQTLPLFFSLVVQAKNHIPFFDSIEIGVTPNYKTFYYPENANLSLSFADHLFDTHELWLDMECSAEVIYVQGGQTQLMRHGLNQIRVQKSQRGQQYLSFQGKKEAICKVSYAQIQFLIYPEKLKYSYLSDLRSFHKKENEQFTNMKILKDPYLALSERFQALYGRKLEIDEFEQRRLNKEISELEAPQLDLIILNTLHFEDDFIGRVHLNAIKFHAERGAKVYLLNSEFYSNSQISEILSRLSQKFENIYFKSYSAEQQKNLKEIFHSLHRVNHVKALITYSKDQPENNYFISGGRNISENYFYSSGSDIRSKLNILSTIYFDDVDFSFQFDRNSLSFLREYILYNENQYQLSDQKKLDLKSESDVMISVPYISHEFNMEKSLVEGILSAKKSIFLTTPYLNLTEQIRAALELAYQRGVQIQIVTNFYFDGDTLSTLTNSIATSVLTKYTHFDIRLYKSNKSILHAKSMLVDDSILFLGSMNMNRRSFRHDTETIYSFRQKDFIGEYQTEVRNYFLSNSVELRSIKDQFRQNQFIETILKLTGDLF